MDYIIRDIAPNDNEALAKVIRTTLEELDRALDGTVYTDPTTDHLYEYYQFPRRKYFVAVVDGKIVGGSGIAPIENQNKNYCELQKMYLSPDARGKGIAKDLMQRCLDYAKEAGFEMAYLETFDSMHAAQALYKKFGFDFIDGPLGDTGHFSCNTHMTNHFSALFTTCLKNKIINEIKNPAVAGWLNYYFTSQLHCSVKIVSHKRKKGSNQLGHFLFSCKNYKTRNLH